MKDLKLKICGMKDPENIRAVAGIFPHYMGFIFYEGSPRYAGNLSPDFVQTLKALSGEIEKVGVFVNADFSRIMDLSEKLEIRTIQLHGEESPVQCLNLKKQGLRLIKVFKVGKEILTNLAEYEEVVDYFLLDTKGEKPGGNGRAFDWEKLKGMNIHKPFFLSGGLSPVNYEKTFSIDNTNLMALDVNSGFEIQPGLKNILELSKLKYHLDYAGA